MGVSRLGSLILAQLDPLRSRSTGKPNIKTAIAQRQHAPRTRFARQPCKPLAARALAKTPVAIEIRLPRCSIAAGPTASKLARLLLAGGKGSPLGGVLATKQTKMTFGGGRACKALGIIAPTPCGKKAAPTTTLAATAPRMLRNGSQKKRQPLATRKAFGAVCGSVDETAEQHLERHSGAADAKNCVRCNFIRRRDAWMAMCPLMAGSKESFLIERPTYLGGAWGLGCSVCQRARRGRKRPREESGATTKTPRRDHRHEPRASKWARCGFNGNIDPRHANNIFKLHMNTLGHRAALLEMQWGPATAPSLEPRAGAAVGAPAEVGCDGVAVGAQDLDLLRGRVPQGQDWLDAWVDSSRSFRGQAASAKKRAQSCPRLEGKSRTGSLRHVRRKQTRVMAEVVRQKMRRHLKEATCISLVRAFINGKLVRWGAMFDLCLFSVLFARVLVSSFLKARICVVACPNKSNTPCRRSTNASGGKSSVGVATRPSTPSTAKVSWE